jgi:phytanoyl-CoA hydroxylase
MRDEFDANGFCVVHDVFSAAEIATISAEVDRVIEGSASYLPAEEIIYEPGTETRRVRNAFRLHLYNDAFLGAAKQPKLIGAIQTLLGRNLRLYGSQVFAKPPRVGTAVPRHQDMAYWPFEPHEMISAWIAIDDSTIENGCVRYSAGSHRFGLLPHGRSGVAGNSLGMLDSPTIASLPEHAAEVRKGSCILHHCLTVHRSEPNSSANPGRGLIYIYMSDRVHLTDPSRLNGPEIFLAVGD